MTILSTEEKSKDLYMSAWEKDSQKGENGYIRLTHEPKFRELVTNEFSSTSLSTLIIGGGTQSLMQLDILKQHPNGEIDAIDLSTTASKRAKSEAEKYGIADRCRFLTGDAAIYEYDRRYNRVVAINSVLSNPEHQFKLFKNIKASLTRDGKFVLATPTSHCLENLQKILPETKESLHFNQKTFEFWDENLKMPQYYLPKTEIQRLLSEAPFYHIDINTIYPMKISKFLIEEVKRVHPELYKLAAAKLPKINRLYFQFFITCTSFD